MKEITIEDSNILVRLSETGDTLEFFTIPGGLYLAGWALNVILALRGSLRMPAPCNVLIAECDMDVLRSFFTPDSGVKCRISLDKKYKTADGRRVRIYATDSGGKYPVHGAIFYDDRWDITTWTTDGLMNTLNAQSTSNLVECKPWEDYQVDDKVIVWNNNHPQNRQRRYFARVCPSTGRPLTFDGGATSWSQGHERPWDNCELAVGL